MGQPLHSEWILATLANLDAVQEEGCVLVHYCRAREAARRSVMLWLKLYGLGLLSMLNIFLHLIPLWIVGAPWQGFKRYKILRRAWEVLPCEVTCPSCRQSTRLERQVLESFSIRDLCKHCERVIVISIPSKVPGT